MSIQRKLFRYEMKKQENATKGTLAKTVDRLKVLRSVLAAGFAVLPFFANEAFAAGEITRVNDGNNLMQNGKADIYAESVSGDVGLNRFQSFNVEKNELANLYFRTKDNSNALNTLVNTVNDRINIYGTVNAIRNNKVGGNLYFLSPKGMVVGASGAINAGALTVMTAENSFNNAKDAQDALSKNDWKLNTKSSIDIHGKLNAATGIDLRAAYINVKKEKEDAEAPLLRTGLLFNTTVNTEGLVDKVTIADGRLTAVVDSNTKKIVIADPNDATNEKLKGDGSINLKAEATEKNAVNNIFDHVAITNLNAVESGVEVGSGAEIDALGDVNISATATYDNQKYALELWDVFALSKADVKVDGSVKGYNVNLKAEATSSLNSDNMKNLFDMIDRAAEDFISINGEPLSINDALTDSLENLFIDRGFFKKGTSYFDTINNIMEQVYMPFGFVKADAAVSQGAASQIIAQNNLTAVAKSTATNNFSVAIQPKLQSGDFNISKYFSGGFMYVDTDSNATVDIGGAMQAGGNMTLNAAAINTSISSLVVKPPRTFENPDAGKDDGNKDDTSSGTGDDTTNKQASGADAGNAEKDSAGNDSGTTGKDDSGNKKDDNGMQYAAVAITINSQDGQATVNLGAADKSSTKLKAGGALNVAATNVNTLVSNAIVAETENTLLNTAINIADSNGKATINANVGLEGASVQLNSNNEMKKLSMNTDGSTGPELSGTVWAVNTPYARHGMDVLSNFIKGIHQGDKAQEAAGQKKKEGQGSEEEEEETPTKVKSDDWRDAFNVGMSLGIALVDNKAATNIAAGVPITATGGDIGLGAKVTIDDTQLVTNSLLNLAMRDEYLGAVTAVSIQDMDNSAEVNIAADDKAAVDKSDLQAKGNIKLNAEVDNSYKRLDNLVQAVEDGWKSFEDTYDKDNADQSVRDAVQSVEGIVADIMTMFNRNSATNFVQNKQFAMKSKAALDIVTQIEKAFGADELVAALKNLVKASNYANMYVSASTDKMIKMNPDVTAMVTGAFGMQDLNNTAKVNVGANRSLTAGAAVDIDAAVTEQNALLAGKWQLIPDLFTTDAGENGLGGTVGVQTASNNSEVIVNNGVIIKAGAGDIALNTKNDIINTSLVMGGAWTSSLGVTGMVNYVGGESNAKTLVDDDVNFIAHKKLIMGADNDTVLTAVAGDFGYSNNSSIGASVSVIDYDVKTLAQVRNLEAEDKNTARGTIVASGVDVSAHTDGIINSFALAGSVSKSANENKDKGGTETATKDGKGKEGVEKAEVKAEDKKADDASKDDKKEDTSTKDDNKKDETTNTDKDDKTDDAAKNDTVKSLLKDTAGADSAGGTATPTPSAKTKDSIIKVDAAGSVAWNYVNDETNASLEGVAIGLKRAGSDDNTTSVSLKAEDSSYIGAYSGAAALSKFGYADEAVNATKAQGMLSGAVAVNDLYKNTTGRLNDTVVFNVGLGRTLSDNITNLAQNTGAQVAAGLAMGVELGKKAGSVDINLGGSGSANYVDSTVQAEMTNNVINDYFNVSNIAYDKDLQVGGGINFEFARGNAAAGAAISINDVDNKIKAIMQDNLIGSDKVYANKIENLAVSNLVQVGTATSIGITAGGQKSFFLGDVAIAVNMVDNDVQAVTEKNNILASEFVNEARDGKLYANEAPNKYIEVINSTNSNDILVDESTGKFYILDEQGAKHYIVSDGDKFIDEKGNEVDVSTPGLKEIIDLDAAAALENANGENGVDFGRTNDQYTSEAVTIDNSGNIIVGSAIGVAVKITGSSSNVAAAVATNVNHINNSFKADTSQNTINALNGVTIKAESDTLMVAVAAGAAASIMSSSTASVDVAGSGVDNTLHNDTIASVTDSEIETKQLHINSSTKSDLISVAGQLSTTITTNYGGAAGMTWAQSTLDNTTGAYARGITWKGYDNNGYTYDMKVTAVNDSSIITVGAGVSGAMGNVAAQGAYAGSYGTNDTKAIVEKSDDNKNNISYASSINVSATDTSDISTVAGNVDVAGSSTAAVTAGGVVANTQLGRHVQASLNDVDASLVSFKSVPIVNVLATDTASTLNLAIGGGVAVGAGVVGVSAQGSVAVVNADGATTATMNNTNLNSTQNSASLNVEAYSENEITTSADSLSVGGGAEGGVAAGAAVSVLLNSRDTLAQVDGGSWQLENAAVKATSKTKLENITTGVTAAGGGYGSLGVTASVQVDDFDGLTEATVNNVKGSVSSLEVKADRTTDIKVYNNGFALTAAPGSASIGAGVTVVDDKSQTLAGLIGSNLQRFDSGGVAVNASNTTNVDTEISNNNVALSIGAALGTGVQVVNLEAQAAAVVAQSTLGESGRRFWNLDVNAKNSVTNNFTNVVDSESTVFGVAVGIGVLNMNTQTTATVDDATVYANNINVIADEERNAKALLVGVEAGAIGVGVNLMNTNIGGQLEDAYTYQVWNEETQSYDTYKTYTIATDGVDEEYVMDIQGTADSALGNANAALGALNGNAVSDFTLNKGSGDGKVAVKVNNSILDASDKLSVQAQSTNNVYNDISQNAVSGSCVAVAGDRTTVQENQSVEVNQTVLQGKSIDINSVNLGSLRHKIERVGFTIGAYSDTVSYIKHSGENKLYINDSELIADDALNIAAQNKVEQLNTGWTGALEGLGFGRIVLEGKDELDVDLQLKAAKGSKLTAKDMQITAENAAKVKNEIEANVSVGLVSAHGASAESRVSGAADISIGKGSSFSGENVSILAKTGAADGYTTEALNHAVSVSGVGVSVNRALTENSMHSSVDLAAAISISGALDVQALNTNSTNAYVHSVNVGVVASSGDNFAKVEEDSEAAITIDTSAGGLDVGSLNVLAQNEQNVTAKADGSGSGLLEISPYTAKVMHEAKSKTSVTIQGGSDTKGTIFSDGDINVQALRKENTNLKADALSVTLVGSGDAYVENSSVNDTQVNVTNTSLKNNGKMLLKADNNVQLNKADGYNEMLWGQGYAGGALNLAGITNTLEQQAKVALQKSTLNSKGMLDIVSHSEEDLNVNGYVYAVGLVGGSDISLRNKITNNEQIEIADSDVKTSFGYADITMSAADDLKLFTYCLSETPAGILGDANSCLFNTIKRTNDIQLTGKTKVYGMHDVNYYAGKNLDGSLGKMDLDSEARNFNGNIIPIALNPKLENHVTQHNTLTIAKDSSSMSVRHTNIYADTGDELVRAHVVSDTMYGTTKEEGGYVTEADGTKIYNKTIDNYVDINGAVAAGMDNKINIVIGQPGDLSFFDEEERNALTNKKALSQEELLERITVSGKLTASGTTEGLTDETAQEIRDNIKLGTVDYEETLLKRYNEVIVLMSEYESDGKTSAAYLGYMLEAERLFNEMKKIGELTEVDGVWVLNSKQKLDYIELPELAASGGNIVINTANLKSTAKTGSLDANGSPEINITNNTNLMLKLGAITVDDGGGRLLYNNQELTGKDAAEFDANIAKLNDDNSLDSQFSSIKSETGIGGDITIKGNYSGAPVDFAVVENGVTKKGQYVPKADILVSGDIYNKNGSISITTNNNITIAGESAADSVSILGADVALTAGGSITQTFTDGIVNIGRDVQEVYASEYDQLKSNKKSETINNKEGGSPANGSAATGSYIAGGVVSINATDINVNGVIQSGYADYELILDNVDNVTIKNQAEASIEQIKKGYTEGTVLEDSYVKNNDAYQIVKGGAYWDSAAGCYKYRLSAWYNPSTKKILVQDVNASGGKIYLTGRISSTGGGKLISLDGVSNINIASNMDYVLSLGSLITNDVQGLVSITDTAGYVTTTKDENNKDINVNVIKVTEYTNGKVKTHYVDIKGNIYNDAESAFDQYGSTAYNPKSGLRYTWSSGTKNTEYTRYKKDDMDGGWGAWDLSEKEDVLKEWSTSENMVESGKYENEVRKEGTVIQETDDISGSRMDYEHTQIGEPVRTTESDRYYNTGVFGCHKHHETIWTESVGSTDTYYASIKADNRIDVKFIGQKADEAVISVQNVMNGIELTGSVGNRRLYETTDAAGNIERNVKGTININSGRINSDEGIIQTNGSLYGRLISLQSSGDLKNINIAAGDSMYLYMRSWKDGAMADVSVANLAGAKGDLYLGAESDDYNTKWGTLDITNTSTSGNIVQMDERTIVADRINIKTLNGSVSGDNGRAMLIKGGQTPTDGDSLSASVNVTAKGDINLAQYDGDLRVGRIYSQEGDVTLDVAGSVIDALPDNNDAQGSEESRIERWKNIGLIDGGNSELMAIKSRLNKEKNLGEYQTWDKEALLYAFSESIVNPTAAKLDTASKKDPNIIGHNINITAGGSIGKSGETKEILLTGLLARDENGNLKNPDAIENLKALSKADVTNVSLRTDENGNKIAVIKDVQPLGIQQSEGATAGKLNIKSTAKGSTNGDIFLQGREEVSSEKIFSGRSNNDLNIDKIITENGRATITSLGAINKLSENMNDVNIQAQNLYLTGLRDIGSLNLKLYGQDITGDGLSVISGGNVSVSQQGDSRLILRNIAADDINITADNSIVMGTAGAGLVDYYLQAEAGHDIKITSHNGDLGEFAYDADGKLLEAESSGLRIKNTEASQDTNIKLTAEKGRVGLDASAGIEAVKNLEIKAAGDVLLYGGTIGSERTTVESINGSIIGYDKDAIEGIDVVLTAKKGSVSIDSLKASGWLQASGDELLVGSADIGNGLISVGQKAVFDKLRTDGILQAENVRDYLGYDLGDGMRLTLTGGRSHRFDTLFMHGRDFYELDRQRLFAETLLEKVMDYDIQEKLISPHVRPGLLFSRYNLVEEQEDEDKVSI